DRRRMLDKHALLPAGGFEIVAGIEMRAADPEQIVECKRVLRREIERNLEPFDSGLGVSFVQLDKSTAAPGPGRASVGRERPADRQLRSFGVVQQAERAA